MPGTTLTKVSHISHFKSRRNPEGPLFFNPDFSLMETEAERGPCIQRYNTKTEQSSDVNSSLPDLKYVLNYCLLPNNLSLISVPFLVSCGFCICNRPKVRGIFLSILLVFCVRRAHPTQKQGRRGTRGQEEASPKNITARR